MLSVGGGSSFALLRDACPESWIMGTYHWARWAAATACIALLSPGGVAPASAQFRPGPDRSWQLGRDGAPYERGYQEGVRQGDADGRQGRAFDVYGDPAYRAGDRGYNARFGDRNAYRNLYRRGFEQGYRDGYGRARAGRGWGGPQAGRGPGGFGGRAPRLSREPAVMRGFNDGYEQGLRDGRDGDRYDPVGSRDYRDGDNGYSGSYGGTREIYKNNYRAGFREGYEEGYRDAGRYGRR
jgi:hypothetical protein